MDDNIFTKVFGLKSPAAQQPDKVIKPEPEKYLRTIDNIYLIQQAQKIFNPSLPQIEQVKAPTAPMAEQGTSPVMGAENSPWGNPINKAQ